MSDARRVSRFELIGFAFGVGALEHTIGLIGLAFGWQMYADYPAWRHLAFACVDASIASMAFRKPERVFVPLLAFLVEQLATNGVEALAAWRDAHHIQWFVIGVMAVLMVSAIAARPSPAARRRMASS